MNLCSDNHDEVCHEGKHCPACAALEEKDREIQRLTDRAESAETEARDAENEASSAQDEVGRLEDVIAGLRREVDESQTEIDELKANR